MMEFKGVLASVMRWARPEMAVKVAGPSGVEDELRALGVAYTTLGGMQITGPRLRAICEAASEGSGQEQAALFLDIREREPLLEAHLGTRRQAVTGAPWALTSEANAKQAEELTKMLRRAGIGRLIGALSDVVPTGYAGAVIDWDEGGKGIRGFVPVHPTAFEFDQGGNPAVATVAGGMRGLGEFHPWQFVFVASEARPGLPSRLGLMRTLLWFWLFKHQGVNNWVRFMEKFGMPMVVAKLPAGQWDSALERNKVLASLKKFGPDGAGVLKEGTEVEFMNAVATGNVTLYTEFCRYIDELYTLLILGQLATSQAGSGLSNGGMQESVRQDLAAADAALLSGAILRQVVEPLARMLYGWTDAQDLEFCINTSPAEDLKSKAETYKLVCEFTGRYLDAAQVEAEFDVKLGDEVATQTAGKDPEGMPGAGEGNGQNGRTQTGEVQGEEDQEALVDFADTAQGQALEAVVADALRRTVADAELWAAWMGPVQAAIRESFADLAADDLEGFRARIPVFLTALPGVLGEMDAAGFERALSGAMLAAVVNGYTAGGL